ncbi:YIP1 family protein [bacterium]|nr:YIP1 family protein [FCB group bacterium]MBL7191144.1 YIP1 family protein [bacterium]
MENEQNISAQESAPQLSIGAKIAGVFLDPRKTFSCLAVKPDFIAPLIILAIVSLIFVAIAWPVIEKESFETQIERMQERGVSQEDIDKSLDMQKKMGKYFGFAGAPIGVVINTIIITAVLLFIGNVILGGSQKFKFMFGVYAYSALIQVPESLIKLLLVMNKGTLKVYTSLALLFPQSAEKSVLFKIAEMFDIFTIWQMIVLSIGMAVIYKFTTQKTLTAVGTLYVLFHAVRIVIGNIF